MAEAYVNFLSDHATPKAITLDEIKSATAADPVLQLAMSAIQTGQWKAAVHRAKTADRENLESLKRVSAELCVNSDRNLILRGTKLVIPSALQDRVLAIAHEGHQGVVRTKQLLREKVWFAGIDVKAEKLIAQCLPCQASTPQQKSEPLKMSPLPSKPWSEISVDFAGPYPSGDYIMVILDEYSRFPVAEVIRSTAASTVIPHLDRIFAIFGIPDQIKTDNGPPFNGQDFAEFTKQMGCKHRRITPLWPQANAEVERCMRTIGKTIKAATVKGEPWKQALSGFLRNYRSTPHPTTGASPAELMFGRPVKIKLPEVSKPCPSDAPVRQKDASQKEKMKEYADKRSHAKPTTFKIGDQVLVRQPKTSKLTPPYSPKPYAIIRMKGSQITARNQNHHWITRNSSHFKLIPQIPQAPHQPDDNDDEDDDDDKDMPATMNTQKPRPTPAEQPEQPPPAVVPQQRRYPQRIRRPTQFFIDG